MRIYIDENGITEAQASAVFFLEEPKSKFNTANYAAVVDIGGGTVDISFWKDRNLQWEDSVKFAGGDLLEVLKELKDYVKVEGYSYDLAMRKWPFIHHNWDKGMEEFSKISSSYKVFRKLGLFYGGICYYIGLHMKSKSINTPLSQIALAGNGIRFLELITIGLPLSNESLEQWISLLNKMITSGHNINEYAVSFGFSPDPKLEVARGLVSSNLPSYCIKDKETSKKILGLGAEIAHDKLKFDEWDSRRTALDFSSAKIDFTNLIDFIQKFKEEAKKYFKDWKVDELEENFSDEMRADLSKALELRGDQELANFLFLEALKSYMKNI